MGQTENTEQVYEHQNYISEEGNPVGGYFGVIPNRQGPGKGHLPLLYGRWQNGPLVNDASGEQMEPNGIFVETLLKISAERLRFYQGTKFACSENAQALSYINTALEALRARTSRRVRRGIEGTNQVDISTGVSGGERGE